MYMSIHGLCIWKMHKNISLLFIFHIHIHLKKYIQLPLYQLLLYICTYFIKIQKLIHGPTIKKIYKNIPLFSIFHIHIHIILNNIYTTIHLPLYQLLLYICTYYISPPYIYHCTNFYCIYVYVYEKWKKMEYF